MRRVGRAFGTNENNQQNDDLYSGLIRCYMYNWRFCLAVLIICVLVQRLGGGITAAFMLIAADLVGWRGQQLQVRVEFGN